MDSLDLSFHVHMGLNELREELRAQMAGMMRSVGILLLVCLVPVLLAIVAMGADVISSDLTTFFFVVFFFALAVFAVVIMVRPPVFLKTRGPLVRSWFSTHGTMTEEDTVASTFLDTNIDDLSCDFEVTLYDFGFSQVSSSGTLNVPWFALKAKRYRCPSGICFPVDNGKQDSALYNLVGFNWMFREENVDGSLFIPREVTERYPDLEGKVLSLIEKSRAVYLSYGGEHTFEEDVALQNWLEASDVHDLREDINLPARISSAVPLQELTLTSRELFILLGGQDTGLICCTKVHLDLEDASKAGTRRRWRRQMVDRLGASGWIDGEGRPVGELADALRALGQMGRAISGCQRGRVFSFEVCWGAEGAAGLELADPRDPEGGWRIVRFSGEGESLRDEIFGFVARHLHPLTPAGRDYHLQLTGKDAVEFSGIFFKGRERKISEIAMRVGIDQDMTSRLSGWVKHDLVDSVFLWDFTGCVPDESGGWRNIAASTGPSRQSEMVSISDAGVVVSSSAMWRPGMPDDWRGHYEELNEAATVVDVYAQNEWDIRELLADIPAYPETRQAPVGVAI